jgi:hypothetical protein
MSQRRGDVVHGLVQGLAAQPERKRESLDH